MNKIRPATEKLRDSWWSKRGLDAILAARKEADHMNFSINLIIVIILFAAFWGVIGYLIYLLIKALRKYIRSEPVRREKSESARSLGEVLKKHRTECKMTQEFVAEAIGVSRQSVSKWESGASDPSTTNLIALAKLYGLTAEELLQEMQ